MRSRVLAFTVSIVLAAAATTAQARNPWEGQPAFGRALMNEEERRTFWREMNALQTVEEKEAYWQAHIEKMQQRALERGVSIPDPPKKVVPVDEKPVFGRPPYFEEIMTEAELTAYRETERATEDPVARRAFIADHIRRMQARGAVRGVSIPSTTDWNDLLERAAADAKAAKPEAESEAPGGAAP
jgi:hypothetical protein